MKKKKTFYVFFQPLQTMKMNYLKIHRNHSLPAAISCQTNSMATKIISTTNTKMKMKEKQMPTKK